MFFTFLQLQLVMLLYLIVNLLLSLADRAVDQGLDDLELSQKVVIPLSCVTKLLAVTWLLVKQAERGKEKEKMNGFCLTLNELIFYKLSNIIDTIIVISFIPYHDYATEAILRCLQFGGIAKQIQKFKRREIQLTSIPLMYGLPLIFFCIFRSEKIWIQHCCISFLLIVLSIVTNTQICLLNGYEVSKSTPSQRQSGKDDQDGDYQLNIPINVGVSQQFQPNGISLHTPQFDGAGSKLKSQGMKDISLVLSESSRNWDQLNQLNSGILIVDEGMNVVYRNALMTKWNEGEVIPQDGFELRIAKLDKVSMKMLGYSKQLNPVVRKQASVNVSQSNTFADRKGISYSMQIRSLESILLNMFSVEPGQFLNHAVQVLDLEQEPDASYHVTIQMMMQGSHYYCLVQINNITERDTFLKRVFTFKIMRSLFMSFSHEFGTSLNYILALSQVAESDDDIPLDLQINFFKPISRAGAMMQYKVQDMLDYNKILGKEFQMTWSAIDIPSCIRDIRSLFINTMQHKQLDFTHDMDAYNPTNPIVADQQRMMQVIVNLVANAQKFTREGSVNLLVMDEDIDGQHYIKIMVEDTGIGMELHEQERLKTFLQTGVNDVNKISNHSAGYGLGLLISNQIASALSRIPLQQNGGLQFESSAGVGSKFWFLIKNRNEQLNTETQSQTNSLQQPLIEVNRKHVFDMRTSQINTYYLEKSRMDFNNIHSQRSHKFLVPDAIMSEEQLRQFSNQQSNLDLRNFQELNLHTVHSFNNFQWAKFKSIEFKPRANNTENSILSEVSSGEQREKIACFQMQRPPKSRYQSKASDLLEQQNYQKQETINIEVVGPPCHCKRVLVVDDEPTNIFALFLLLKKFNLIADSAQNGAECMEMVRAQYNRMCSCDKRFYDLILMDLNMPVMDGFQATKAIRDMQSLKQPTICAVTAFVDVKTKQDSYEVGMNYFMNKPVKLLDLTKVLQFYQLIN